MSEQQAELTRIMGTPQEPDLACLADVFVKMIPPTTTSQMTGQRWTGKYVQHYKKQAHKDARDKYFRRFFEYRLVPIVEKQKLFARIYFYWPPPIRLHKKLQGLDLELKDTTPDVDNACKLFLDSVQPLFFDNDSRIVHKELQKAWCHTPGVYFGLWKVRQT